VRELATALAERGNRVLIWDRPNCGASDVRFDGSSESAMQADVLAGLLRQLGTTTAVIAGGSGGARVSLLTVSRHRDVAAGLATWWISGGVFGLMVLGVHYCSESLKAAWNGTMADVAALPEWAEVIERNPANRELFLREDRAEFVATMERWMAAYCPCGDELVPGLPDAHDVDGRRPREERGQRPGDVRVPDPLRDGDEPAEHRHRHDQPLRLTQALDGPDDYPLDESAEGRGRHQQHRGEGDRDRPPPADGELPVGERRQHASRAVGEVEHAGGGVGQHQPAADHRVDRGGAQADDRGMRSSF